MYSFSLRNSFRTICEAVFAFVELFAEEIAVEQTAHVQEEAATKIQAAFRGMQAREQVKAMKTETQVKVISGSQDDLDLDNLDLELFAPKPTDGEDKDRNKVTFSDCHTTACENTTHSLHERDSGASDSSSELGDDFELIKDNRESASEDQDMQDENKVKASKARGARNPETKHDQIFPVTKGGLQKSKVSSLKLTHSKCVKSIIFLARFLHVVVLLQREFTVQTALAPEHPSIALLDHMTTTKSRFQSTNHVVSTTDLLSLERFATTLVKKSVSEALVTFGVIPSAHQRSSDASFDPLTIKLPQKLITTNVSSQPDVDLPHDKMVLPDLVCIPPDLVLSNGVHEIPSVEVQCEQPSRVHVKFTIKQDSRETTTTGSEGRSAASMSEIQSFVSNMLHEAWGSALEQVCAAAVFPSDPLLT